MGRPGLLRHRKFIRLARLLKSSALALGHLEIIWHATYEAGDDCVGSSEDVEYLARWQGAPGELTAALLDSGFVDECPDGSLAVHDLYDHAPDYVQKRMKREAERRAKGVTVSQLRAQAGRKGGEASGSKRRILASENEANGKQTEANGATPTPAPSPTPAPAPKETTPLSPAGDETENGSGPPRMVCQAGTDCLDTATGMVGAPDCRIAACDEHGRTGWEWRPFTSPPASGTVHENGRKPRKSKTFTPDRIDELSWPASLDNATAREALETWLQEKIDRGQAYKSTRGPNGILAKFADIGAEGMESAIAHSIANNYAGVFVINAHSPAVSQEDPRGNAAAVARYIEGIERGR